MNLRDGAVETKAAAGPLASLRMNVGAYQFTAWELHEFRYSAGEFRVYRNGVLAATITGLTMAAFLLNRIGGTVSNTWFDADIGRCISMVCSPTGGENAIPVIRATLAALYGITLP